MVECSNTSRIMIAKMVIDSSIHLDGTSETLGNRQRFEELFRQLIKNVTLKLPSLLLIAFYSFLVRAESLIKLHI